jgi:hypothetical protein
MSDGAENNSQQSVARLLPVMGDIDIDITVTVE